MGVMTGGGVVDAPIGRHPVDRLRMAIREDGREAVTHYRVLQRFRAPHACAVETGDRVARIRSACTWRTSAIRSSAIASTAGGCCCRRARRRADRSVARVPAPGAACGAAGVRASGERASRSNAKRRCRRTCRALLRVLARDQKKKDDASSMLIEARLAGAGERARSRDDACGRGQRRTSTRA